MIRMLCVTSCVLMLCGCGIHVTRTAPLLVGDRHYVGLEYQTRHLFGPNLRNLHLLEVGPDGQTKLVYTSGAVASGVLQAILPSGMSTPAQLFLPMSAVNRP